MSHEKPFKRARSGWTEVVLVCRKCSKKLDGGFGDNGDQRLAKVLRKRGGGKGRKAQLGVIEVDCLTSAQRTRWWRSRLRPPATGLWFRVGRRLPR